MSRLYVREAVITYRPTNAKVPMTTIRSADDALPYFEDIRHRSTEHFQVLALDAKNRVIGQYVLSKGAATHTVVDLKDLFRFAILANAVGVLLGHNHPSGDSIPSLDDIEVTHKIVSAADTLGIVVLDHLIIGADGFTSISNMGMLRP